MALVPVLAGLVLASAPGRHDDPPPVAPVFSVGGGYAVPFGRLFESDEIDVNNAMKGGFPVRAEVGVALGDTGTSSPTASMPSSTAPSAAR